MDFGPATCVHGVPNVFFLPSTPGTHISMWSDHAGPTRFAEVTGGAAQFLRTPPRSICRPSKQEVDMFTRKLGWSSLLVAVLLTVTAVRGWAAECSLQTLNGRYGFSIEGTIVGTTPLLFVTSGTIVYEGNGNLSGEGPTSFDGSVILGTFAGTYTVNPVRRPPSSPPPRCKTRRPGRDGSGRGGWPVHHRFPPAHPVR